MKTVQSIILSVLLIPAIMMSYPAGVAGVTMKSATTGCSCHSGTKSASVIVAITGPAALNPGKSGSYTVTVTDAAGTKGGIDIAASTGALAPVSSSLKLNSGELTHSSGVAVPSSYKFTYTAPATVGSVTLYATAKGSAFSSWNSAPNFPVTVTSATLVADEPGLPASFALEQNYPNPFNPATKIQFTIPSAAVTSVKIFDITGREVASLVDGTLQAGVYAAQWDASGFPSGVYLCRMTAGQFTQTKKLILQK